MYTHCIITKYKIFRRGVCKVGGLGLKLCKDVGGVDGKAQIYSMFCLLKKYLKNFV